MIGMNLYATAVQLIGKSDYTYFAAGAITKDPRGFAVPTFAAGVPLRDSIQAVPRSAYKALGLDFDRKYVVIYTDNDLLVTERGTSGDQIEYNGARFQLVSDTDWRPMDGWRGVLAVRQNATVAP